MTSNPSLGRIALLWCNKIIMRMGGYSTNEKISKVITLSSNYKRHREVVATSRPAIDCSDTKHMQKALKLSAEKDTYTKNVRQLRLKELKR